MALPLDLDAFRSPADNKHYRVFTLANGLEVMLVQNEASGIGTSDDTDTDTDDSTVDLEPDPEPFSPTASPASSPMSSRSRRSSRNSSFCSTDSDADNGTNDDNASRSSTCHAAACMTVSVGSLADPSNLRGLAHYLEHMLFMGSAKYPDENAFESFLATHGGFSNGATEAESTRFLFEVASSQLAPALDMFAQFFVAPLFQRDALERELLAVESEFNRAKLNDYVRLQQIQCATSAPGHAYHDAFSWGNAESLGAIPAAHGVDVREAMIAFYERYYTPQSMKLCVYGHDTLDTMQQWVTASFGPIAAAAADSIDSVMDRPDLSMPPPFGAAAQQSPIMIQIQPVSKMHALHLYWPVPPQFEVYKQKPSEYLAHILGHEGAGSLTAALMEKGWGTYVTAGISEHDSFECGSFGSLFEVAVTLTRDGVAHWDDVVQLIFDVVHFVVGSIDALPTWIFDELKASSAIAWRFADEPAPLTLCKRLSHLLQQRYCVDRCDLLQYDTLQGAFDASLVRAMLSAMMPANTRIALFSHAFEEDDEVTKSAWQCERWTDALYTVTPLSHHQLTQWATPSTDAIAAMRFPCRNPFMPQRFDVLANASSLPTAASPRDSSSCCALPSASTHSPSASVPALVYASDTSKLWFKQDDVFYTPKTNAHFLLCLPAITHSVEQYVCARLYVHVVCDALQQARYQASNANMAFDVDVRDLDMEVTCSGFSDSIQALVHAIMAAVVSTTIDPQAFVLQRTELLREYRNALLTPATQARYLRLQLLERTAFAIDDQRRVLEALTLADVERFRDTVMWRCDPSSSSSSSDSSSTDDSASPKTTGIALRSLVHGNCLQADAIALHTYVEQLVQQRMQQTSAALAAQQLLSYASIDSPRCMPTTPTRAHTTSLPVTRNGLLLRALSERADEPNSAVEVYYQLGRLLDNSATSSKDTEATAIAAQTQLRAYATLLQHVMHEPLFDALRTQQQLGYDVACSVRDTHGVLGLSITVQSASHAASDVALRIDAFVRDTLAQQLQDAVLTPEVFARTVATLQQREARPPATLIDETHRYWDAIQSRRMDFGASQALVEALGTCTVEGLRACYKTWLLSPADGCDDGSATDKTTGRARKLRVHVVGQSSSSAFVPLEDVVVVPAAAPVVIQDLRTFKQTLRCHC